MKFNYIVGNPPYQDSSAESSGSKLWKSISQRMFPLYSQEMVFITPQAASLMLSKMIKDSSQEKVKFIDYQADTYFDVGVKIVSWGVSKNKNNTTPKIISLNGDITKNKDLWDASTRVGKILFERLKKTPKEIRMVVQEKSNKGGDYVLHNNYLKGTVTNGDKPTLYKKKKLAISTSRALKEDSFIISNDDFAGLYALFDLTNVSDEEYLNLKSFLFSKVFTLIQEKYKLLYNTGFNNMLWYIPKLDLSKPFTNKMVCNVYNLTKEELEWLIKVDL